LLGASRVEPSAGTCSHRGFHVGRNRTTQAPHRGLGLGGLRTHAQAAAQAGGGEFVPQRHPGHRRLRRPSGAHRRRARPTALLLHPGRQGGLMQTVEAGRMASIPVRHGTREASGARLMLATVLSLLVVPACDVGPVPDSGQCVLSSPLTCSRLTSVQQDQRPHIIFDTDAQFHGDPTTARLREQGAVGDQYALIYLLLRSDALQLLGVTTANANGGPIDDQVNEVERVASLCGGAGVPVKRGAGGHYADLQPQLGNSSFEGSEAVDFIVASAHVATPNDPLIILLGTKATNVALALTRDPTIAANIAVYWTATDEPGAAEQTNYLSAFRPGGSGMYNVLKDPEAATSLFAAPIDLHLMQLWDVRATPSTQPRFAAGTPGLGIEGAAHLACTGPRVAPVAFPDGSEYYT